MDYSDGKEELKWQNIDADDLPAAMRWLRHLEYLILNHLP